MAEVIRNIHGRRSGRGVRPWLLLPKVMSIAVYFGSVTAMVVLWWTTTLSDPEATRAMVDITRRLFVGLTVPALLLTATLGVGLFMQMPQQFMRLRWWQVKMASLAVGIPLGHFWVSGQLRTLRAALDAGESAAVSSAAAGRFRVALLLLLAGSAWVIVLGRLKPRLGQNLPRALASAPAQGLEQSP